MEETLKQIMSELAAINGRLGNLEEGQQRLEGRMDHLEAGQQRLEGRIDVLDGRMDRLEGRMDRLEGRIDVLDGRMDRLEGRMDHLEAGQQQLAAEQSEMRKEIAFYYGSMMRKLEETRTEMKSDINHILHVQMQHQSVLELLNKQQQHT